MKFIEKNKMTCQMQMLQLEENYQRDVVCFWWTQELNNAEKQPA